MASVTGDDRMGLVPLNASHTLISRVRSMVQMPFVRYVAVGITSNRVLYVLYLLLTLVGIGHKVAMTIAFIVGILQTFALNRAWTFRSTSPRASSLVRYAIVYAGGYVISWLGLWVFVDRLGYPHQLVQAVLILVVAVFIFVNLKFWVFRGRNAAPPLAG